MSLENFITQYPPKQQPLMVYDGQCGFCKYWVIKWEKITSNAIDYQPLQEIANGIKDIPRSTFKDAVQLINTNGKVYSGARAAYFSFFYVGKYRFLFSWYGQYAWFKKLSDWSYRFVASNRSNFYRLSVAMFGANPKHSKPYWAIYLILLVAVFVGMALL